MCLPAADLPILVADVQVHNRHSYIQQALCLYESIVGGFNDPLHSDTRHNTLVILASNWDRSSLITFAKLTAPVIKTMLPQYNHSLYNVIPFFECLNIWFIRCCLFVSCTIDYMWCNPGKKSHSDLRSFIIDNCHRCMNVTFILIYTRIIWIKWFRIRNDDRKISLSHYFKFQYEFLSHPKIVIIKDTIFIPFPEQLILEHGFSK